MENGEWRVETTPRRRALELVRQHRQKTGSSIHPTTVIGYRLALTRLFHPARGTKVAPKSDRIPYTSRDTSRCFYLSYTRRGFFFKSSEYNTIHKWVGMGGRRVTCQKSLVQLEMRVHLPAALAQHVHHRFPVLKSGPRVAFAQVNPHTACTPRIKLAHVKRVKGKETEPRASGKGPKDK